MDAPVRRLLPLCMLVGLVLLPVRSARAAISDATNSTTGATCSGWDCRNSVAFTASTPTSFTSRYAWTINALSTQYLLPAVTTTGTAQHNISFNVTANGGYRLDVTTSRVGELYRSFGSGTTDTSAVAGSSNLGVPFGSLGLPDPGALSSSGNIPFSQSGGATIFWVSNGVPQSHTLTFTWDGSVTAHLASGAVRQGENSTQHCAGCQYPGSPSRTQETDGHFVTVTFTSLCPCACPLTRTARASATRPAHSCATKRARHRDSRGISGVRCS